MARRHRRSEPTQTVLYASISGVVFLLFSLSGSAPKRSKARTESTDRLATAGNNAVSPEKSRASTSAPCSSNRGTTLGQSLAAQYYGCQLMLVSAVGRPTGIEVAFQARQIIQQDAPQWFLRDSGIRGLKSKPVCARLQLP